MELKQVKLKLKDGFGSKINVEFYPHKISLDLVKKFINFHYSRAKILPVPFNWLKRIDIKDLESESKIQNELIKFKFK